MKILCQPNEGNRLQKAALLASCVCLILFSFALAIAANAQSTQVFSAGTNSLVVYSSIPNITESVPRIDATDLQDIRVVSEKYSIRVRSIATNYQWIDVFTHYTYNRGAEITPLPLTTTGALHPTNTQHYPNFTRGWSHTYGNIEMSQNHPVEVEISPKMINNVPFKIKNQDFFKAAVHPSHKASVPTVVDGKVYFTISNPAQVTIDINGQMDDHNELINPIGQPTHAISLFANPLLVKPPLANARTFYVTNGVMPTALERDSYDILYFMPGVHDIGLNNKIYPGKTYYIPGDAIVFGTFNNVGVDRQTYASSGSEIRFFGYGTISGVRFRHLLYVPGATDGNLYRSIVIENGRDYEVYGVSVVDPGNFSVFTPSGTRGAVRWAKTIGWRANSDGFAGNDNVDDCFMRTSDDSSYVRGNRKRCTFWKDHFSAVFYMAYIHTGTLLIEDCDIIYLRSRVSDGRGGGLFNARGAVENTQTSGALPTNVTFRNLRVHDKRSNMCVFNMASYQGSDVTGNTGTVGLSYSNIKFQNITIAGSSVMQYLLGCAPSPWNAGALTFDNVTFDGVLLTQQNFNSYFVTNQHVGLQTFMSSAIPVTGVFVNGGSVDPIPAGRTIQLAATVLPENSNNQVVSWTSSNPVVASVDGNGLVTAMSAGTATITVTTQDGGKTAIRHLSVTAPPSTDMAVFSTPGTYQWVVPPNISAVTVECRGGGGSGGSVNSQVGSSQNIRGGGGAGGNYAKKVNVPVSSGQTYIVTVGGGGAPSITGFVHNESLSSQTGGSSSFKTADLAITHALATGGVGGKNGLRIGAATGGASNAGGITAISAGSVGDAVFAGGNGSGAGFPATGSGGGGAGTMANGTHATDNSVTGGGLGGDAGGGRGANGVDGLSAPTGNGAAGTAPGGGGSGAARNEAHSSFINGPGGAGGAGSVVLSYSLDSVTSKFAVTSPSSSCVTGAVFDVTITAQNSSNSTITDDTNAVTITSPDSGSFMEFDWDGDGTFGDNSGTLVNGVKTIKARNKRAQTVSIVASASPIATLTPLAVTTSIGAFTKLLLLAPGETAAAGTDTGKTGTPNSLPVGVAFEVTVNAVDDFWNLINTVTDTVTIMSFTDSIASLPANTPLAAGTVLLPVTFNTPGSQILTALDVTAPSKTASISPNIAVTVAARTWGATIDNRWNTTTANWAGLTFADLNAVTFSSTSVNSLVDLNGGSVAPISMLVNATSAAYEISNGSITGMAGGLTKAQASTLILDTNNTYTGPTAVNGGLLRLKNAGALPTTSALILNTGILGLESGNFTRSLGAAAGQVVLTAANCGFAAFGADRTVNLGGVGAQVTWGGGGFFNAGSNLILGHASATHTIDFQNPIDIAGTNREIIVPDGLAAVDAIISGAITNSGANTHLQKNGNGTLMLAGVNAWGNEMRILAGNVMLGGNTGMVIADTANVQLGAGGTGAGLIFDLNGRSETIATLNLGGQNTTTAPGVSGNQHAVVNSGASAVLTINGLTYFAAADPLAPQNGQATVSADINTGIGNKNFNINNSVYNAGSGPLAEEVLISGALTGTSITKLLTGTLVLTNPQYSGNTTISAGTLIVRKAGTQPNANPNNDASTITIASGAVLDLDYTGTDTVASLVIGADLPITSGVYGSADLPGIITGSGKLMVGTDAFLAWASNNPSVLFDGDDNNDAVKNGLAWLLGAANSTANVNGLLPVVTRTGSGLKMTFSMLPASVRAGARLFVEHSSDLGINDPWSAGTLVPDASGGTAPVTFTVTDSNLVDPNNKFDVEASISASEADAEKLFGRLRAEK